MDAGTFSTYQVHLWLAQLDGCWGALHYDNPNISGAYTSEVFGGSYTRQQIDLTEPDSRATWNIRPILWLGLPSVQLTHIGFWDLHFNGNLLASGPLPKPVRVLAGANYTIGAQMLALSFRSLGIDTSFDANN